MSYIQYNSPCANTTPCPDCNETLLQITTNDCEGCVDPVNTECVIYNGDDIISAPIKIKKGSNLNIVIRELLKNAANISLDLTFQDNKICLHKNGEIVKCLDILDRDDQFLKIEIRDGIKYLQIWKPVPDQDPVKINEIKISDLFAETPLKVNSNSIAITQDPDNSHELKLEIELSSDVGNDLRFGSDKKLFLPKSHSENGLTDIIIQDIPGLSFEKNVLNGVITFKPIFDIDTLASFICNKCNENSTCSSPSGLNVE